MMTLKLLKDFLGIAQGIQKQIDKEYEMYNVVFEDFQGLNRGLCEALDGIVDTLDKHSGCEESCWVGWYVFDNDYGTRGLTASSGPDAPLELIDTVEKLYELIQKDSNE